MTALPLFCPTSAPLLPHFFPTSSPHLFAGLGELGLVDGERGSDDVQSVESTRRQSLLLRRGGRFEEACLAPTVCVVVVKSSV